MFSPFQMAISRFDDDEENVGPPPKKRRRPQKKESNNEEDDDNPPKKLGKGRGKDDEDDDDDESDSISTGNIVLDIVLDFWDDCVDWFKSHVAAGIIIAIFAFFLFLGGIALLANAIINYVTRPTLQQALTAYELGVYPEAKRMAERVLLSIPKTNEIERAKALFIIGAATCAAGEQSWAVDKRPIYLAAANYLQDSEKYGFAPNYVATGYFLLGKSLYLSGELERCRDPLRMALEAGINRRKEVNWFLANSYFLGSRPNLFESLKYVERFENDASVTEEERCEIELMHTLILIQLGKTNDAETLFRLIPKLSEFESMRTFVQGQIDFLRAREIRQKLQQLRNNPNPIDLGDFPLALTPEESNPPPISNESGKTDPLLNGTLLNDTTLSEPTNSDLPSSADALFDSILSPNSTQNDVQNQRQNEEKNESSNEKTNGVPNKSSFEESKPVKGSTLPSPAFQDESTPIPTNDHDPESETQSLLPLSSKLNVKTEIKMPAGAVLPILPEKFQTARSDVFDPFPVSVTQVPGLDFDESSNEQPLFQRMAQLRARPSNPYSQNTASQNTTSQNIAESVLGNTTESVSGNTFETTPEKKMEMVAETDAKIDEKTDENEGLETGRKFDKNAADTSVSENVDVKKRPFDPSAVIVVPKKVKPDETDMYDDLQKPNAPNPPANSGTFAAIEISSPEEQLQKRLADLQKSEESRYFDAIKAFQRVRQIGQIARRWIRTAELLEGLCYEELGRTKEAQKIYSHLSDAFPETLEAALSDFLWGNLEYRAGKWETALAAWKIAFDYMRNEPNEASPWVPKEMILRRCEDIIRTNVQKRQYNNAIALLHQLREVMPDFQLFRFLGAIYEVWGNEIADQSENLVGPAAQKRQRDAEIYYDNAGKSFDKLAVIQFDTPEYPAWVWRSATNFRLGKNYRSAIIQYRKFLRINLNEHRPEIFLDLAQMYINLDAFDKAQSLLEDALIDYPNHALTPSLRLLLATVYSESKEWEKAKNLLKSNLLGDYAPDSIIYRDSIYALGKTFYEAGNIKESIPFLEDALANHPNAPQALESHYLLARDYLNLANETSKTVIETPLEKVQEQIHAQTAADQELALAHYRIVDSILSKQEKLAPLTDPEKLMLRNARFGIGMILMELKRYSDAIHFFDITATQYQDRPEALDAVMQMALAYRNLDRPGDALTAMNRGESLLLKLEKNGTVPSPNNWKARIDVQKNILLLNP
ncbi:MAG: tetratricopeptide repeat protein [Thermoguttaceae bacterium]